MAVTYLAGKLVEGVEELREEKTGQPPDESPESTTCRRSRHRLAVVRDLSLEQSPESGTGRRNQSTRAQGEIRRLIHPKPELSSHSFQVQLVVSTPV
jgi:hypothetical protein